MISLAPKMTLNFPKNGTASLSLAARLAIRAQRQAMRLFKSRAWTGVRKVYGKTVLFFTLHPAQTRETYIQHLWFTIKTSVRFAWVGVLLLTHGVFPFLFTRTASTQIEKLYLLMRSRIPQPRRDLIENQYEI